MKRPITSALLAAALSLSLVVPAGAVSSSTAVEAIQALGIITGDSSGDLNLSSPVTRAEFVTMMTAASSYKDSIGEGSGVSLFKDVKSDHWASEYIKLAVEQGWMSGYVDGTFRPDDQITLEGGLHRPAENAGLRLLHPGGLLSLRPAVQGLLRGAAGRCGRGSGGGPHPPGLRHALL